MARGTAAGEPVVSQAQTQAWDEGCAQAGLGAPKGERGRFVWDERVQKLVRAEDYVPPVRALDAPIMTDRFYEGTVSPVDGADIGSRRRRREHMKEHGLVDHDDAKSEAKIVQKDFQRQTDRERRESIGRAVYAVREQRRKTR